MKGRASRCYCLGASPTLRDRETWEGVGGEGNAVGVVCFAWNLESTERADCRPGPTPDTA